MMSSLFVRLSVPVLAVPMLPVLLASTAWSTTSGRPASADRPVAPSMSIHLSAPLGTPNPNVDRHYPYSCTGKVDRPHQSHTVPGMINVHFDTKCARPAGSLFTEGALYRSSFWGWEEVAKGEGAKANTRKLRVVAPRPCDRNSNYRYRGAARFYVTGPEGAGVANVYNQTARGITC
jgi:hypothetical protein